MATFAKMVGALLLLISLGLPMGSCSYYQDATGIPIPAGGSAEPSESAGKVTHRSYVLDDFPEEPGAWLTLALFILPLVAAVTIARRPRGWTALLLRVAEIPAVLMLIAIVDVTSTLFVTSREAGAFVAFAGAGLYLVGAAWNDIEAFRLSRRERRVPGALPGAVPIATPASSRGDGLAP